MRISDWSSDVCSSDLSIVGAELRIAEAAPGAIEHEAEVLPLADQIECAVHRFPLGPVGLHDEHDLSHEGCKHHRLARRQNRRRIKDQDAVLVTAGEVADQLAHPRYGEEFGAAFLVLAETGRATV